MGMNSQFAKTLVLSLLGPLQLFAQTVSAQAQAHLYAGSVSCSLGEIDFVAELKEKGPLEPEEFHDPCRSAQGACNEIYKRNFKNTSYVDGTLSLFPTAGHSELLTGTYMVSGTVLRWSPKEPSASAPSGLDAVSAEALALTNISFSLTVFSDDEKSEADKRLNSELEVHTYIDIYTGATETTGHWDIHSSELQSCDFLRLSPLKRN